MVAKFLIYLIKGQESLHGFFFIRVYILPFKLITHHDMLFNYAKYRSKGSIALEGFRLPCLAMEFKCMKSI